MGKLGEAICCFTEVTLIGCWGHTSEKRIIFCFCTHFVNIHSGINTTTSEFKKKGRNWLLLHVFFPRHTPWTSYNNTTLYVSVFPVFNIEDRTLGVTGQHRMLNAPYDLILPLFFFWGPCLLSYANVFNFPLDFSLWTLFVITTCPSFKN